MSRTSKRVRDLRLLVAAAAVGIFTQLPGLASAQNCITNPSATGETARQFKQGCGLTVDATIPERCAARGGNCALVVDAPGVAVSGKNQEENTNTARLAREAGDVVVLQLTADPVALGLPSFNGGDRADVIRLIEEAKTKLGIDPSRVNLQGFSQGAGMSLDIACQRPDLIASVAVLAPAGGGQCFTNSMPIQAIMFVQSSQDQLVNPQQTRTRVQNIVRAMGLTMNDGMIVNREEGATITRFVNPQGKELDFFQDNFTGATVGGGHCFPGSFEPPQRNANVGNGQAVNSVIQLVGQLLTTGQSATEIVDGIQFACDDPTKTIRFGPNNMDFFRKNPKR